VPVRKKEYLFAFIKEFLPYGAELLFYKEPYKGPAIVTADIDGDDVREIVAAYRWQGESYITLIKKKDNGWVTLDNYEVEHNEIAYLDAGCSLTRGTNNNITIFYDGDFDRDGSSLYETLEWTEQGFRLLEGIGTSGVLGRARIIGLHVAPVKTIKGIKYGYIDNKGRFIIEPKFDYARDFQSNGLAVIEINNKSGIINSTGKYEVEPIYDSISDFSEGRAVVIDKGSFKVIDESGRVLTTKTYSFIGSYQNGRALFGLDEAIGGYRYGYLGLQGREVIPAKFWAANDFREGKAVVKLKDNQFALLDLNGRVLKTYNYAEVENLSEGLLAFKPSANDKFGYINEMGRIVIKPQFTSAEPFKEGRAVVNTSEDFITKYGLIDRSGNFLIKPIYNSINLLGESRAAVGKVLDANKPYIGSRYALADINGTLLTDFIYNSVSEYKNARASASDDKNTFFINKMGKIIRNLPIVSGSGTLNVDGNLIKAFIDNRTAYYSKASRLVWQQNKIISLNNAYKVREEKYRPNKDYLVYYPQVEGMRNTSVQNGVNAKLRELSLVKSQPESSFSGDFSVEFFKKNLLVLELDGYEYPFGAAHGMPTREYPHIDLVSGKFYELKDLFKSNSSYVKVLSDIVGEQIKTDPQYEYVFPDTYNGISENQGFYIDENNLYIYFTPYEIAPFAAGFPTFKIPFKDIMNIVDVNKDFWKSFN
jgi:hypothetical protein